MSLSQSEQVAFITVGADVRHWTTFQIKNPTPEELRVLAEIDSPEAVALAAQLFEANRLDYTHSDYEDGWSPFEDHREAAVVEFESEEA